MAKETYKLVPITALNYEEQHRLLNSIREGGGYGILLIVKRKGDVCFAASPVPKLRGYEIVCASPERLYDIWKNGRLVTPNQTKQQVKVWIRENTPDWLCDDTNTTKEQKTLVASWMKEFMKLYPGFLTMGPAK